jgi:hypothetical protein
MKAALQTASIREAMTQSPWDALEKRRRRGTNIWKLSADISPAAVLACTWAPGREPAC